MVFFFFSLSGGGAEYFNNIRNTFGGTAIRKRTDFFYYYYYIYYFFFFNLKHDTREEDGSFAHLRSVGGVSECFSHGVCGGDDGLRRPARRNSRPRVTRPARNDYTIIHATARSIGNRISSDSIIKIYYVPIVRPVFYELFFFFIISTLPRKNTDDVSASSFVYVAAQLSGTRD